MEETPIQPQEQKIETKGRGRPVGSYDPRYKDFGGVLNYRKITRARNKILLRPDPNFVTLKIPRELVNLLKTIVAYLETQ